MHNYSIVVETENLSMADSACLWGCLDSVQKAIAKVAPPKEALLINSGDVSGQLIETLKRDYPWITPVQSPAGVNYYESKMLGIRQVTSEVVILVDSDCSYNEDWLVGLLSPFEDDKVSVVAGETSFVGDGPYSLALSIAHSFDGYSGNTDIYPVNGYYANNVAFRRKLLLDIPIPTRLPLYRHGCSWHAAELRRSGEIIWAQPRSRATHAWPEGFSHFFWRFLLFGRDRAVRARLRLVDDAPKVSPGQTGILHVVHKRLQRALRQRPRQKIWIPFAAVILLFAFLLIRFGQIFSALRPELAIDHFGAIEGVHYPTVEEFQRARST